MQVYWVRCLTEIVYLKKKELKNLQKNLKLIKNSKPTKRSLQIEVKILALKKNLTDWTFYQNFVWKGNGLNLDSNFSTPLLSCFKNINAKNRWIFISYALRVFKAKQE